MGSIEKAKCWNKAQGAGVGEGKRERGGRTQRRERLPLG